MRVPMLNALATAMVGDGKRPNIYFACDSNGDVCAVLRTSKADAIRIAELIRAHMLEDRLTGVVWESREATAARVASKS